MPFRSVFRERLFEGRTFIVTGGGSGIGRCIAHEISTLGGLSVIVGRRLEKLERTASEIRKDGGLVDLETLDIREEEAVRQVVGRLLARHGRLHGLVNNAGGQFSSPLASITQRGFETVVRTNLVGGFLVSREVYTQCLQHHGGSIVNIVADMWRGMPGTGHSGAARAGMVNFTQTAAIEWAAAGVRVNAVAPGWIASSGLDTYKGHIRAVIPKLREGVLMRRFGTEAEVSAAVCFLLSEASSYITGATIRVDGGGPLGGTIWPSSDHVRSVPFEGFHLAKKPRVLEDPPAQADRHEETEPDDSGAFNNEQGPSRDLA
jgi:citronellol/citronellal dehydrogenase